jgi:hypothetical protein
LEKLDEDEIPQNSDAVVILRQWRAAMKQFNTKHTYYKNGTRHWQRGAPEEADDDLLA